MDDSFTGECEDSCRFPKGDMCYEGFGSWGAVDEIFNKPPGGLKMFKRGMMYSNCDGGTILANVLIM